MLCGATRITAQKSAGAPHLGVTVDDNDAVSGTTVLGIVAYEVGAASSVASVTIKLGVDVAGGAVAGAAVATGAEDGIGIEEATVAAVSDDNDTSGAGDPT